jgi:hypothetical protein
MPEWVWTALGLWISASILFGFVAWLYDGYMRLTTWRPGTDDNIRLLRNAWRRPGTQSAASQTVAPAPPATTLPPRRRAP